MKFDKRPTVGPSFNRGWRLAVAFGASAVLLAIAAILLSLVGKVCVEYF